MTATSTTASSSDTTARTTRGKVLDMLKGLLAERRDEEVIALVAQLVARNANLELLLAKLREKKNRGEHVASSQLALFLAELKEQTTAESALGDADQKLEDSANANGGRPEGPKPPPRPPLRRPPPPGLRRVKNPIDVPQEERACPQCGSDRRCVFHETTEVIELIPAEVIVRQDIREILACDTCDAEMQRAPMGDKVVAGGAYGSTLVATLVVGKYKDGLPLYRQSEMLERLGLPMPSSSMSEQIQWATDLLRPIWRGLLDDVRGAHVLHVDATSLPVRDKDTPQSLATGSLWGYVGVNGDAQSAVYLYTSTGKRVGQREGEIGPLQFLAARKGFIVADAAGLFDPLFHGDERVEVGCNMHARRYFFKALDAGDKRAAPPIAAFKALYEIEACQKGAPPEALLDQRRRHSKPVYDELLAWCRTYQPHEPPSSLLGKAVQYLLNHQRALTRFLDDATLPIDNGIVERLHRIPALTRKAYIFAGSHAGAERAAIAYSILGSCHLADVNPVEYLADVLPRLARDGVVLARDVPAMLPAAWKRARSAGPSG